MLLAFAYWDQSSAVVLKTNQVYLQSSPVTYSWKNGILTVWNIQQQALIITSTKGSGELWFPETLNVPLRFPLLSHSFIHSCTLQTREQWGLRETKLTVSWSQLFCVFLCLLTQKYKKNKLSVPKKKIACSSWSPILLQLQGTQPVCDHLRVKS